MQINVYTDFQTFVVIVLYLVGGFLCFVVCFVALMCACVCVRARERERERERAYTHTHVRTHTHTHKHTHTHLSTEKNYRKGTNAQLTMMVIKHKSRSLL